MGSFIASTSVLVLVLVFGGLFLVHFLPIFVAASRHVRNLWWIVLINVLLGWTVIGWVVALVWAFTDQPDYRAGYMPRGGPGY